MIILLDAMGGDNAPDANIKGAVNAINQIKAEVVLIGKEEDNFATLDVAIFDQNTCEVDFIKVSACPTLLKEKGKI